MMTQKELLDCIATEAVEHMPQSIPWTSIILCKSCADLTPEWKRAYELACLATAPEDPIPCWNCGHCYHGGEDRGHLMDCFVPNHSLKRFP